MLLLSLFLACGGEETVDKARTEKTTVEPKASEKGKKMEKKPHAKEGHGHSHKGGEGADPGPVADGAKVFFVLNKYKAGSGCTRNRHAAASKNLQISAGKPVSFRLHSACISVHSASFWTPWIHSAFLCTELNACRLSGAVKQPHWDRDRLLLLKF